jgi:hypothetical protein
MSISNSQILNRSSETDIKYGGSAISPLVPDRPWVSYSCTSLCLNSRISRCDSPLADLANFLVLSISPKAMRAKTTSPPIIPPTMPPIFECESLIGNLLVDGIADLSETVVGSNTGCYPLQSARLREHLPYVDLSCAESQPSA